MISLYRAIVKKINHEHEFELINSASYFGPTARGGIPTAIIYTYMCKCGKVKTAYIGG